MRFIIECHKTLDTLFNNLFTLENYNDENLSVSIVRNISRAQWLWKIMVC